MSVKFLGMLNEFRSAVRGNLTDEAMAASSVRRMLARLDPAAHNGAPLPGLNRAAIKSHGGSDRTGLTRAILEAGREARLAAEQTVEIRANLVHAAFVEAVTGPALQVEHLPALHVRVRQQHVDIGQLFRRDDRPLIPIAIRIAAGIAPGQQQTHRADNAEQPTQFEVRSQIKAPAHLDS